MPADEFTVKHASLAHVIVQSEPPVVDEQESRGSSRQDDPGGQEPGAANPPQVLPKHHDGNDGADEELDRVVGSVVVAQQLLIGLLSGIQQWMKPAQPLFVVQLSSPSPVEPYSVSPGHRSVRSTAHS